MGVTGDNFRHSATYYDTSERNLDKPPKHHVPTAELSLRELLHEMDISYTTSAKVDETREV